MYFTLRLRQLYVPWGSVRHAYHACCPSLVCLISRRAVVVVLGPLGTRAAPHEQVERGWMEAAWPCQGQRMITSPMEKQEGLCYLLCRALALSGKQ